MRAELNITYVPEGDLRSALVGTCGQHDQTALEESELWQNSPAAANSIAYAARRGNLIVMAELVGAKRAVVYIESAAGRLREGALEILDDLLGEKALKPKLANLTLLDEAANDTIATARSGLAATLAQGELFVPIATGAATALAIATVSAFGHGSADFFYGSVVALVVAIISIVRLIVQSSSRRLVWQ